MIRIRTASGFELLASDFDEVTHHLREVLTNQLSDEHRVKSVLVSNDGDEVTLQLEVQAQSWSDAEEVTQHFIERAIQQVHGRLSSRPHAKGAEPEFVARGTELALA